MLNNAGIIKAVRTASSMERTMAGKIILVTGGARSGKSVFAERYASNSSKPVAYMATAQIYDEEMKDRVTLHQSRRPAQWLTFEAPYEADRVMLAAGKQAETILFDCLTLYTSNLMLSPAASEERERRHDYVMDEITKLLDAAIAVDKTIIFVTNEVGMGIVPDNAMAREYRDLAGLVNQKVAAQADEVYLVVSGLAVEIKARALQLEVVKSHG